MVVHNISPQRREELQAQREREEQRITENIEQTREFLRKSGRGKILDYYDTPGFMDRFVKKVDQFLAGLEYGMFILAVIALIVFMVVGVWNSATQ